jgi:hypothetical protein
MSAEERAYVPASESERRRLLELIHAALPGCELTTVEALVERARVWTARRNTTIYRQGEPVPLTLILSGYGAFQRTTVDGQQIATGVGGDGNLFGWSSVASVQSSVELMALTDCRIAQWPGPEIRAPGVANMRHIDELQPAFVKVGIESVRGIDLDPALRALVSSLVSFCAATGSMLVAKGIETEGELAALRAMGVRLGQGFLLGRPQPTRSLNFQ